MKFHFYSDTPVSIYQQIASQPAVLNMPLTLTKSEKPVYKQKKVKKKRSVKPAKKSQSNKAFTLIKVGVFSTIGAVLAQLMFRTPFLAALSLYLASNAVENKVFQGIYKGQGKLNSRMLQGLYKLSTGKNKSADAFTQSDRLKVLPALSTFTSLSFEIILAGLNFLIGNERRQAAIKKKMISVTDFLKLNKVNTKKYQSQLRLLRQKTTRFYKKYLLIPKKYTRHFDAFTSYVGKLAKTFGQFIANSKAIRYLNKNPTMAFLFPIVSGIFTGYTTGKLAQVISKRSAQKAASML